MQVSKLECKIFSRGLQPGMLSITIMIIIIYEYLYRIKHFNESSLLSTCVLLKIVNQTETYEISYFQFFDKIKG